MIIKNVLHKRNVHHSFLVTYMLVVLLFVFSFLILTRIVANSVSEYDRQHFFENAQHSEKMLDKQIGYVKNICTQIKNGNDSTFDLFLDKNKSTMDKRKIFDELRSYTFLNSIIDEVYLFSNNSNVILSSLGGINLNSEYGDLLRFGDMSLSEFRDGYLNGYKYDFFTPVIDVYEAGTKNKSILYIESYSPSYVSEPVGYIVISINLASVNDIIGYTYEEDEELVLYDSNGSTLWTSVELDAISRTDNDDILIINGKKNISYVSDNYNGLNFVYAKLYNSAVKGTTRITVILFMILIAAAVAGVLLSVYFANKNSRPVEAIASKLKEITGLDGELFNEYEYMAVSVDKIINDMSGVRRHFEDERWVLVNDFANSMLIDKTLTRSEIISKAEQLNLDIAAKRYVVMIVELVDKHKQNSIEAIRATQKSVNEEFNHHFDCITCMYGTNTIAIIFRFDNYNDSSNIENIENITYTIGEMLYSALKMYIKCALGTFCSTIEDIPYSYQNARKNIESGVRTKYRNVAWYMKNDDAVSWYYYPDDVKYALESAFSNKDEKKLIHTLDFALQENYLHRAISESIMRILFADMEMTMYNIISKYRPDINDKKMIEIVGTIEKGSGIEAFFESIKGTYVELMRSDEVSDMRKRILNYVDEAALSSDFDRQTFANHFYISADYVTRFFKENTGYGFVKYVAKVKIDRACKLLIDTDYSVERIAEEVGYNSAMSFRRAFKSYMGLSPTEYRHNSV